MDIPMEHKYLLKTANEEYHISLFINKDNKFCVFIKTIYENYSKEFRTNKWLTLEPNDLNVFKHINSPEIKKILPFIMFEYNYFILKNDHSNIYKIHRINLAIYVLRDSSMHLLSFNEDNNIKKYDDSVYGGEIWIRIDESFRLYFEMLRFDISKGIYCVSKRPKPLRGPFELIDELYAGREKYSDVARDLSDRIRFEIIKLYIPIMEEMLAKEDFLLKPLYRIISEYCFYVG